jgi:hypothetical protein
METHIAVEQNNNFFFADIKVTEIKKKEGNFENNIQK